VPNGYYPVYSDQRRGNAGYCAWHSSGTINGIRVQFGFFFKLDGDPGCDPQAPSSLGHSQGLSALANVSGHELSEMLTDPQLNAWYDQKGDENADKCAWTFNGTVAIAARLAQPTARKPRSSSESLPTGCGDSAESEIVAPSRGARLQSAGSRT